MTPQRTDQQLIDQLTAASVEIDGQRWVHAARAMRIIGCPRQTYCNWQTYRGLRVKQLRCDRSRRTPSGRLVALHLADLLACLGRYSPRPNWTEDQDEQLAELYGRQKVQTVARKLGRSLRAIKYRACELGLTLKDAQGLLTAAEAARMLGVSSGRVSCWCTKCSPPLKHRRVPARRSYYQIDPADLHAFLVSRPDLRERISPLALERLARRAIPAGERRKAVAA